MHCPTLKLASELIRLPSLSPNDAGCQKILIQHLQASNFTVEAMHYVDTENFWAYHGQNSTGPTLVFAGHTDVVPAGDLTHWHSPPFEPTIKQDYLYGRGAADMKGSVAAMIIAAQNFIKHHPQHRGRLAFLITSDEEASATNGTNKVVEKLIERQEKIDYCVVGEPSCSKTFGDTIKNGRRGSLTANLYIQGIQGHVAYPDLADNPIHRALPFITELVNKQWDQGNQCFPPTSMQIANLKAGTGNNNVIPGELFLQFNFRFSTELTSELIQNQIATLLKKHQLTYRIEWNLSGLPFLTPPGKLVNVMLQAVKTHTQQTPQLLTTGGTSDGRFIALTGAQVVEFGPINTTIHKVNECVSTHDLQTLTKIYQQIMELLLT